MLLSLALHWGEASGLSLATTLARVTSAPVAVLGAAREARAGALARGAGALVEGGAADLCVFDPKAHWTVTAEALRSQGKHTPFAGYELPGRVRYTLVAGAVAFEAGIG